VVLLRLIAVAQVASLRGRDVAGLAERETLQAEPPVLTCAGHAGSVARFKINYYVSFMELAQQKLQLALSGTSVAAC
jgi:hypothetical protein